MWSDSDLCRAVVRGLVSTSVRAPYPQSGCVYKQMCPYVSAKTRTGPARQGTAAVTSDGLVTIAA
jgi:hypothetical protein